MQIRALRLFAPWFLAAIAAAQVQVRIAEVPLPLELPLEPGRQAALVAEIAGGEVTDVWLAVTGSRARVQLEAIGRGRYYLNLADRAVDALLRADAARREFAIFARTPAGDTVASEPLRYELRRTPAGALPRLILRGESPDVVDIWGTIWASPHKTTSLEVPLRGVGAPPLLTAWAGGTQHEFRLDQGDRCLRLQITPELRAAWQEAGDLLIDLADEGRQSRLKLRARPERLELTGSDDSVTIVQRHSGELPGSRGYLRIRLGDITAGQVLLEIRNAEGELVLAQRSVRQGDEMELQIAGRAYYLTVEKLVNLLIGDDFAVLAVASEQRSERDRILALLEKVAASQVTFLREGEGFDGKAAAEHLRRKLEAAGEAIRTVEQFIDRIGTRSSTTGKPYRVRLPAGEEMSAAKWLRSLADG